MKIKEEDSFENDVDNLFESTCTNGSNKKKPNINESDLMKEF